MYSAYVQDGSLRPPENQEVQGVDQGHRRRGQNAQRVKTHMFYINTNQPPYNQCPHTDNNLEGCPIDCNRGLGDYAGGRLRSTGTKRPLHIRDHAVVFSGLQTHSAGKLNGDRWSLVLFAHASWATVSDEAAHELRLLGLPCPPKTTVGTA